MKNEMKHLVLTAVIAGLMPVAVFAQSSLDEEVNAELDQMYGTQKTRVAPPRAQRPANGPVITTVQVSSGMPVSVNQNQQATAVQKQPTTVIEAAPLAESNAEKMRKSRQEAELSTEQTIVEKLEQSRLDDEKRRAEVLFGDKFNALANKPQPVVASAPTPVPVVTAVPEQTVVATPVVIVSYPEMSRHEDKESTRDLVKSEVSAQLADMQPQAEEKPKSTSYFSGLVGAGDYPDAANVRGQYSLGIAYGKKFDDHMVVEGSLLYSNYQVEQRDGGCFINAYGQSECYPRITEMNQYSTGALLKYQMGSGRLRPELGGLLAYTYRTFSDTQMGLSSDSVSSHALDMGLMTGASLDVSETFSLGLDFRYMWNLTNKVDGGFQKSYVKPYLRQDKPIEQMNYYTFSLSGRATF